MENKNDFLECFEIKKEHILLFHKLVENPSKFYKLSLLDLINILEKNPYADNDPFSKDISYFSNSILQEAKSFLDEMKIFLEILKDNIFCGVRLGVYEKRTSFPIWFKI